MSPTVLVSTTIAASAGAVRAEPLGSVEVRTHFGVSAGGGSGRTTVRTTPLTFSALGRWAVRDQPRISAYGGLVIETLDRVGAGMEGGMALLSGRRARLRAGAKAIAYPYTLYGPTLGASVCTVPEGMRGCADVMLDVFVAGTDLPDDGAAVQVLFGLGVVIDAL